VSQQILTSGKVKRGYLGVSLESVRAEFARVYGLPEAKGAIVADVTQDRDGQLTPAVTAGLQPNDVIIEFNGQVVQNSPDLIAKVAGTSVGQTVTLAFLRDVDGKLEHHTTNVTLGERPDFFAREGDTAPKEKTEAPKAGTTKIGLTLGELTSQVITDMHLSGVKGLYVKSVDPNGLAADVRPNEIVPGEVVTRINRVSVTALADFQRVVDSLKPGDAIVLNLSRYDRSSNRITLRIVQFTYQ